MCHSGSASGAQGHSLHLGLAHPNEMWKCSLDWDRESQKPLFGLRRTPLTETGGKQASPYLLNYGRTSK